MSYSPPPVVGVFLAQFDTKTGYKLVWSKTTSDIDLEGLDYKSLPSGVHEFDSTTVLLSHHNASHTYYGLSRYRLWNYNEENDNDRLKINMYSLGILTQPKKTQWKPNEFIGVGWEYISSLDEALDGLQSFGLNLEALDQLFIRLTQSSTQLSVPLAVAAAVSSHPLCQLPRFFEALGPLLFPVYKHALVRDKILFFNPVSLTKTTDFFAAGSFTYLLSLLSVVPQDIKVSNRSVSNYFSQPVYQVGLNDINTKDSVLTSGFIGATNDEVMKYQDDLFDVAVTLDPVSPSVVDAKGNIIKSTLKDYHKFQQIQREAEKIKFQRPGLFKNVNASSDDVSSIRTSNTILSNIRYGYPFSDVYDRLESEPGWWLDEATSPMSWREYIWSAFAWFASAGGVLEVQNDSTPEPEPTESNSELELAVHQLVTLVNHFHSLTKKWFYIVEDLIRQQCEEAQSLNGITIELTYQDIVDMELDPYSRQDLDFASKFIKLYWAEKVDEVDIGIGIQGICC